MNTADSPEPVEVKIVRAGPTLRLRTGLQVQKYLEHAMSRYEAEEITSKDLHNVALALLTAVKIMERVEHERELRILDRACGTEREFPRLVKAEAM